MNDSVRTLGTLFFLFSFCAGAARAEGLRRFGVVAEPEPRYRLMDHAGALDGGFRNPEGAGSTDSSLRLLRRPANLDPNRDPVQRRQVQRMAEEIGLPSGSPW